MKKHFHQVMLELVRQDAFAMEVGAYRAPWLPDKTAVVDAFRSFTDKMTGFWGEDSFFAVVNYVDANDPILFCYREGLGEIHEEYFKNIMPADLFTWLYKKLEVMLASLDGSRRQLLVAPYVVQKCPRIQQMLDAGMPSSYSIFGDMGDDLDSFLYTRTSLFPEGKREFPGAYYSSALVASVDLASLEEGDTRDKLYSLCNRAEALSIKFQMSWGYPQLLKDREETGKEKAVNAERIRSLERMAQANELAKELTTLLGPVSMKASELNRILKPLPSVLIASYQRFAPFIQGNDDGEAFKRWNFRHNWIVSEADESFRAQLACILLAYMGADIPLPGEGVDWNYDPPWLLLSARKSGVNILKDLHPNISATAEKIPDLECAWCEADIDSFLILKACFYSPFKTRMSGPIKLPHRLTGPLFSLWMLENQGTLQGDISEILFAEKALDGDGWPPLSILPGLHGLVLELRPDRRGMQGLAATSIENSKIKVTIPITDDSHLQPIRDAVANFVKSKRPQEEMLGSLHDYVNAVLWAGGHVEPSTEQKVLEITFPT